MRIVSLAIVVAALSGCAVGNKHTYTGQIPMFSVEGSRSVAVASEDRRPYIVSASKTPDFVGLSRGGFGNPFDVSTESGKPLSDDFSTTIARSLQMKGFKATTVAVGAPLAPDAVRALVQRSGAERLALVSIYEWKSDTYMNTMLNYDVLLRVFDQAGSELANNRVTGQDNLGGSAMNPPNYAKGAVPPAYRRKLEELFSSPAVVNSLR